MKQKNLRRGVLAVAYIEAAKGAIVLLAGFGVLGLLHKDLGLLAADLVGRLHFNPSRHYPAIFIQTASNITDKQLWFFAGFALLYSLLRFVEAYGLWRDKSWAEWFALLGGAIYVPIELYELHHRVTWVRLSALVANIVVIIFMALVLQAKRASRQQASAS